MKSELCKIVHIVFSPSVRPCITHDQVWIKKSSNSSKESPRSRDHSPSGRTKERQFLRAPSALDEANTKVRFRLNRKANTHALYFAF